jgi:uncharacterized protein YdhG (YjbR/CyaY superfamily)
MMNFEQYLQTQPTEYHSWIETINDFININYPECIFSLSYQIPTYHLGKKFMIHFAVYKNHIGLYPGPKTLLMHHNLLSGYRSSKGAIQVPKVSPLPFELIQILIESNIKD